MSGWVGKRGGMCRRRSVGGKGCLFATGLVWCGKSGSRKIRRLRGSGKGRICEGRDGNLGKERDCKVWESRKVSCE